MVDTHADTHAPLRLLVSSMSDIFMLLLPPITYAQLVSYGARHPPTWALRLQSIHNIGMTLFSAYVVIVTTVHLRETHRLDSWYALRCHTPPTTSLARVWTAWYWSKMWEWFDTALLLARRKPITSLHYNHHLTTASMVAIQTTGRHVRTPLADVGMLLNAGVHVAMYYYYLRPRSVSPSAKRALTIAQTSQHAVMCMLIARTLTDDPSTCDRPALPYIAAIGLYALYFVQFRAHLRNARAPTRV